MLLRRNRLRSRWPPRVMGQHCCPHYFLTLLQLHLVRLLMFQNAKTNMNEFSHRRPNGTHFGFTRTKQCGQRVNVASERVDKLWMTLVPRSPTIYPHSFTLCPHCAVRLCRSLEVLPSAQQDIKFSVRNLYYPITVGREGYFYDQSLAGKGLFIRWQFGKSH